jgi:hypothetical protein
MMVELKVWCFITVKHHTFARVFFGRVFECSLACHFGR